MKTIIKLIIITAFFFSCQPSVKKENKLSETQTYHEFDSKMLIDKEYIDLAEELGSDYYSKHDYFYGVITSVDKDFHSFKIKILKSNQNNTEGLGYDITGMEWEVKMNKVKYLDNNEMCKICFSDFKKLMIPGRKLKFDMLEGFVGGGTAYHGMWYLTYAKEFKDN